jgi:histone H3/H4
MISKKMFHKALIVAGATQVSDAALVDFETWMTTFMNQAAAKAVQRMQAAGRVRIEVADLGE